jgi:hypothetical protein
MTNTEKLNAVVDYIRDAERFHLDNARRGRVDSGYKSMAIQDLCVFMEYELGIEYIQYPSELDNQEVNGNAN